MFSSFPFNLRYYIMIQSRSRTLFRISILILLLITTYIAIIFYAGVKKRFLKTHIISIRVYSFLFYVGKFDFSFFYYY